MSTAYTFINHAYATDSSNLRWSQTSLGAGNYCFRSSSILVTHDKIVCIDGTFGTAMFNGIWNYQATGTWPAGNGVRDIFEASDGRMYTSGLNYGPDSGTDHKPYIFESADGLTWTKGQLPAGGGNVLMKDAPNSVVWKFTEDKDGNVFAGEYPGSTGYTGIHVWRRTPGVSGTWSLFLNLVSNEINRGGIRTAVQGNSQGSGYQAGDILNVVQSGASGGTIRVDSVNESGQVLTFHVYSSGGSSTNGALTTSYAQASNLPTSYYSGSNTGSGFTVNITILMEAHTHGVYYWPKTESLYIEVGDQDHGMIKIQGQQLNNTTVLPDGSLVGPSQWDYIVPNDGHGHGVEVTSLTGDGEYLYAGFDAHSSIPGYGRSIFRITDDGTATTLGTQVLSAPLYSPPSPADSANGCTVWSWADSYDGKIVFGSYGSTETWAESGSIKCSQSNYWGGVVASSDQGVTWEAVKRWGDGTKTNMYNYSGSASYYRSDSPHIFGSGLVSSDITIPPVLGRVVSSPQTWYVDPINGVDYFNFGTSQDKPMKTFSYLETLGIGPGDKIQLASNSTFVSPFLPGWSGTADNPITLSGTPTTTLSGGTTGASGTPAVVSENFEGATSTWAFDLLCNYGSCPAFGLNDVTRDSGQAHSGTYSAHIHRDVTTPKSTMLQVKSTNMDALNLVSGTTMSVEYWAKYGQDVTANTSPYSLLIYDDQDNANLYTIRLRRTPANSTYSQNELLADFQPYLNQPTRRAYKTVASQEWHQYDLRMGISDTDGWAKLYVDGVLTMQADGIPTVTAGHKVNKLKFNLFTGTEATDLYIDDFKLSNTTLDNTGAINTAAVKGYGFSNLSFENLNLSGSVGAVFDSASTNISAMYSTVKDALFEINAEGTTLNNLVLDGGRIVANANTTIQNVLGWNTVAEGLTIATGKVITGAYNWFQDAISAGSGTYTDGGHNTWSATDPNFVSPSDYNLQYSSPDIDAGTVTANMTNNTTDMAGNPIYGTPDIGAYEYQPPLVMGTDGVNIGAGGRIYGDGKFRDLGTHSGGSANLSIFPTGGSFPTYTDPTETRPAWLDIKSITNWTSTHKTWTEENAVSGLTGTVHIIGGFVAGKYYDINIDGVLSNDITGEDCVLGICKSSSYGIITFNYEGDYSSHIFDVEYDSTAPTVTMCISPTNPDGSGGWYITQPSITLTASDIISGIDAIIFHWGLNPDEQYANPVVAPEGVNILYYHSINNNGIVSPTGSLEVKTDSVPPTLNITAPVDGSTTTASSVTFTGTSNDVTTGVTQVTVNGVVASGTDNFSEAVSLAMGINLIPVIVTDGAGNTTSYTITITREVTVDPSLHVIVLPQTGRGRLSDKWMNR